MSSPLKSHNVLNFQQEIIWKAVRAFWMTLVTDFEKLDEHEGFRAQIFRFQAQMSGFEERMDALDNRHSRLQLEVEKERNQAQQYLAVIEDKTREIDRLTVALRTADDEASQEQERQHVLIARLRASVRFKSNLRLPRDARRLKLEFFGHRWPSI
jgi:chromosome segregation ATPase